MNNTTYRKLNSNGSINAMREFYYDYNRMVRNKHHKNITIQPRKLKTSSAVKMSTIISSASNINAAKKTDINHPQDQHNSSNNLGKSHFFRLRSRKQLQGNYHQNQDIEDKMKGQFKNTYNASHNFIRPYLSIEERQITPKNTNTQVFQSIKNYQDVTHLKSSKKNLQQLGDLKRKIQSAQMERKEVSSKLRYNYLLKNRYKHQTQKNIINPMPTHIEQFYITKQHIFPDSTK